MRVKVTIVDSDKKYLEKITLAFNANYNDKIQITAFSDVEKAVSHVNSNRVDLFVINSAIEFNEALVKGTEIVYLVDGADIEKVNNHLALSKYQRIDDIYKRMLNIYSEIAPDIKINRTGENGGNIVSFISFQGGTGVTSVAAAFAKRKAQSNTVFYLSLEPLGDSNALFDKKNSTYTISDVIYALKSKKGSVDLKVESCMERSREGVDYLASPNVALDLMELKPNEIVDLVNQIAGMGYDFVVIDNNFGFTETDKKLLELSTDVVVVLDGTEIGNRKYEKAMDVMKVVEKADDTIYTGKFNLLYNKFSNKTCKRIVAPDVREIGGIPRFDHALTEEVINNISEFEDFDKIG